MISLARVLGAKLNQMMLQKKPGVSASTSSPLPLEDNSAEDEKDADSKTLGTLRIHIKNKHQIYCIQPDLSTSSPFKTLEESSAEDEQDDICINAVSRTLHMSRMHIKRKHQTYLTWSVHLLSVQNIVVSWRNLGWRWISCKKIALKQYRFSPTPMNCNAHCVQCHIVY